MALNLSAFSQQSKPKSTSLNMSAFGGAVPKTEEPIFSKEYQDSVEMSGIISAPPKQNLFGQIKSKIGRVLEPVADFLTNTTARERANIEIGAREHKPVQEGISIKVPFLQAQVPMRRNFLMDTVKYLVETPERFIQTAKETGELIKTGVVPEPEQGKLSVDSYLKMNNDFYDQARASGMGDVEARVASGLYSVGQGVLDAVLVGSLLEKGALKLLNSTDDLVAKKQAWEVLGMPETLDEAKTARNQIAQKFHPDKAGGSAEIFKTAQNAYEVIQNRGIPSVYERRIVPNLRQYARKLLSEPGANVISESVASPKVVGELPGTRPVGGKAQPKLGLSIEEREPVGLNLPDEQIYKIEEQQTKKLMQAKTGEAIELIGWAGIKAGRDSGFRSVSKDVAQSYSNVKGGEKPVSFKTSLQNPYVAQDQREILQAMGQRGQELLQEARNQLGKMGSDNPIVKKIDMAIQEELSKQGYDGVIYQLDGRREPEWQVFEPGNVKKAETIYHTSNDLFPGGKPDFDAYFGNENWIRSFPDEFGKNTYKMELPGDKKIIDLDSQSKESLEFMADLVKKIFPKDTEYVKRLLSGDSKAIEDFYEIWTDKGSVMPAIKEMGLDGARFRDEILLTRDAINSIKSSGLVKPIDVNDILKNATVKSSKSIKSIIRDVTGQVKDAELKALNEKLRQQSIGARAGKVAGKEELEQQIRNAKMQKKFLDDIHDEVINLIGSAKRQLRKQIGFERFTGEFGGNVMPRLKSKYGIKEWSNANTEQLQGLLGDLKSLGKSTNFLTDGQITGLKRLAKEVGIEDLRYMPAQKLVEVLGEKAETMSGAVTKRIINELLPTVDIKELNPVVRKVVDRADRLITQAEDNVQGTNEKFSKLIKEAEGERAKRLSLGERVKRALVPQNEEIFKAMSGARVDLTPAEQRLVGELKKFFEKARKDLNLEKYRKNYITHLEQPLMEKIASQGVLKAVGDIFNMPRKLNIPIDVMLELDNIIGSEKFFKFALERKGGMAPTTNIRKIVNDYANLYETKMALDEVLPEGQAVTKLLLQPQTAQWMKRFLQNLKGRGLDSSFKTGKMGWLAKLADRVVDLGYIKLLSLNWKSAVKNIIAGETNNFIWEGFSKYLRGKARFISNPVKATKMAMENHILEGTFAEYSQVGIGKLKKLQDWSMAGQKFGEYEIRGSLFASELTEEEWKSGALLSPERQRELKNVVAITQGIFSKIDSPLWTQHWYGRMLMQMNRWRITNTMMTRRIVMGAAEEVKNGEYLGKNMQRALRLVPMYLAGMYLSYEATKAGYKNGANFAKAMGENLNSIIELITLKPVTDAIMNNPTFQVLGQISYSMLEIADYLGIPGVAKPQPLQFNRGIEDTYIAPVENVKQMVGADDKGINIPNVNIPNIEIPSINIPSINLK